MAQFSSTAAYREKLVFQIEMPLALSRPRVFAGRNEKLSLPYALIMV